MVSSRHTSLQGPVQGEPAVPWPNGDILGVGLEGCPYRRAPDWEQHARLVYMDVPADGARSKGAAVLLHGKNFFGAYWTGVIEALRQDGFRVIVPDLIGWGKSTKSSTLTAASLVTQLRSLLDHLMVDSVVLIGHSTGGLVGMHMARTLPARVHSLVLANPMGLEDDRIGLTKTVGQQDWARDERSMTPTRSTSIWRIIS